MRTKISVLLLALTLFFAGCTRARPDNDQLLIGCADKGHPATEQEIAALFDRWNQSIQTGNPQEVVANYAERSILLPTVSNKPRLTPAEKIDYFQHFLEDRPSGEINMRQIDIACNMAVDSGLYTFHFAKSGKEVRARYSFTYRWNGTRWLIVSHHSSAMPES